MGEYLGMFIGVVGVISTFCGIAGFFLGRKKDSYNAGRNAGSLETDVKYIKKGIDTVNASIQKSNERFEVHDRKFEKHNNRIKNNEDDIREIKGYIGMNEKPKYPFVE